MLHQDYMRSKIQLGPKYQSHLKWENLYLSLQTLFKCNTIEFTFKIQWTLGRVKRDELNYDHLISRLIQGSLPLPGKGNRYTSGLRVFGLTEWSRQWWRRPDRGRRDSRVEHKVKLLEKWPKIQGLFYCFSYRCTSMVPSASGQSHCPAKTICSLAAPMEPCCRTNTLKSVSNVTGRWWGVNNCQEDEGVMMQVVKFGANSETWFKYNILMVFNAYANKEWDSWVRKSSPTYKSKG